jgi:hypothetical protein
MSFFWGGVFWFVEWGCELHTPESAATSAQDTTTTNTAAATPLTIFFDLDRAAARLAAPRDAARRDAQLAGVLYCICVCVLGGEKGAFLFA